MRAIAIVAPPYRETSGGRVVLHRLQAVLASAGITAYLVPWRATLDEMQGPQPPYGRAPVCMRHGDDDIVIYPDIVRGNPFGASRVVRWQLYHPRHPTAPPDRVFYYAPAFGPGPYLRVTDPRLDVFKHNRGTRVFAECWTWRKASRQGWSDSDKPRSVWGSIEIPKSASLLETAAMFSSCRKFVTYDNATFLAVQARLCGCEVKIRSRTPVDPYLARLVAMHPDELRQHLIETCAAEDAAAIKTCRELLEWR
jgi:hypothetical protein